MGILFFLPERQCVELVIKHQVDASPCGCCGLPITTTFTVIVSHTAGPHLQKNLLYWFTPVVFSLTPSLGERGSYKCCHLAWCVMQCLSLLPFETLVECCSFISAADIMALGFSSRRFHGVVAHPAMWRMQLHRLTLVDDISIDGLLSKLKDANVVGVDRMLQRYRNSVISERDNETDLRIGITSENAGHVVRCAVHDGAEHVLAHVQATLCVISHMPPEGVGPLVQCVLPVVIDAGMLMRRMKSVLLADVSAVRDAAEDAEGLAIHRASAVLLMARKHTFNFPNRARSIVTDEISKLRQFFERFVVCHQLAANMSELSGHEGADTVFQSLMAVLVMRSSRSRPSFANFTLRDLWMFLLRLEPGQVRAAMDEVASALRLVLLLADATNGANS